MAAYKTPEDFGAFGGAVDNKIALQAWLNSGGCLSIERFYETSEVLTIKQGTKIIGIGKEACGIKASPLLDIGVPILQNERFSNDLPIDGYISLVDLALEGISELPNATNSLLAYIGVQDFRIERCRFNGHRRHLVALSNCHGGKLIDNEFSDWATTVDFPLAESDEGKALIEKAGEGGQAFVMHRGLFDGGYALWADKCTYIDLKGNHFHDGLWTAILANGSIWDIENNKIERCKEAGIFQIPYQSTLRANKIFDISLRDICSNGMEVGGVDMVYEGNIIARTGQANIYLTNPINVVVSGNVLGDCNEEGLAGLGCITMRSVDFGPEFTPDQLVISGNTMGNKNGKASNAIAMYNYGGGAMNNVMICGNTLGGKVWKDEAIYVDPNLKGDHFFVTYSF